MMQDRIRIGGAPLESARDDRGTYHDAHELAEPRPCTDSVAYEVNCLTPRFGEERRAGLAGSASWSGSTEPSRAGQLKAHSADVVVADLTELLGRS
jgi:hypothetical protein